MSLTSGFFNSINGDRKYNAVQMTELFNGIINDGVFANIGTAFAVTATGNVISVGVGRAWFNSTWINNDEPLELNAPAAEVLQDRYDAVVIEVNHEERLCAIKIITGTASTTPSYPSLDTGNANVHWHALAFIHRPKASTEIKRSHIRNCIGTSYCPYITGILQVQSIDKNVAQWEAEFDEWTAEFQNGAIDWLNSVKDILSEEAEVTIANKLIALEADMAMIKSECEETLSNVVPKTGSDKYDSGILKPCMTGPIFMDDTEDGMDDGYIGYMKARRRNANSLPPFYSIFGAGRDDTKGGSASICVRDSANKTKGRLDIWDSGVITYRQDDSSDYYNISYGTILKEGLYYGTGTHGSSNPNNIVFGFTDKYVRSNPKLVLIFSPTTVGYIVLNGVDLNVNGYKEVYGKFDAGMNGISEVMNGDWSNSMKIYACYTAGVNNVPCTLWWYNDVSPEYQMNVSNRIYKYIVIG